MKQSTMTRVSSMAKRLMDNGNDQPDTDIEKEFRNQIAKNDRQAGAEEIQGLIYYQNKCFLNMLRVLGTTSSKDKALAAAALLFGNKVSSEVIDEMIKAGISIASLNDYQIHKLCYQSLFLSPDISVLKALQEENILKSGKFEYSPDARLTILFKALQSQKAV